MQHYVGLDVSVKGTSVCIVDKPGRVIREVKVATEPVAIFAVLTEEALAIERLGLEAGPLSQWLYSALAEAGLPGDPNASQNTSTKSSTAPAARWRTGSRNASSTSLRIAPRPPPCGPISCAYGSTPWLTS